MADEITEGAPERVVKIDAEERVIIITRKPTSPTLPILLCVGVMNWIKPIST